MTVPVVAAIPTLENLAGLKPLVEALLSEERVAHILVQDNGLPSEGRRWVLERSVSFPDGLRVARDDCAGLGIYQMWNRAWQQTLDSYADAYLLILNDDVTIGTGLVGALASALDNDAGLWIVSPDSRAEFTPNVTQRETRGVHGTFRHAGIAGWCFMLQARCRWEGVPPIDERFKWWGGDDDLVFSIEDKGGRAAVLDGVGVAHPHETTARNHAWCHEAAYGPDLAHWREKWGHLDAGWEAH
jgi:GT2 family glycosyltransferase